MLSLPRYGNVKATPFAAYKLLKAGEDVLLFPGGAREVVKRKVGCILRKPYSRKLLRPRCFFKYPLLFFTKPVGSPRLRYLFGRVLVNLNISEETIPAGIPLQGSYFSP
jgi:hypothetical protein